jgi:hypothetical protein
MNPKYGKPTSRNMAYRQAIHSDWEALQEFDDLNWHRSLKRDPSGKLHLIRQETTIEGKRFEQDANVEAILRDASIDWNSPRRGVLVTDTLISPQAAAKLCIEDYLPDDLLKYVHVHD